MHSYRCHFGHVFHMRGHRLSRWQPCDECSRNNHNVEAREI
jgi:hypothetical protein